MSGLHEDRVVWVTGAASGIGRYTAEEIVSEGGKVVATDLGSADFGWAAGNDAITVLRGDVTDPQHNTDAAACAVPRRLLRRCCVGGP